MTDIENVEPTEKTQEVMISDVKDFSQQRFYEERLLTRSAARDAAPRSGLCVEVFAGNLGMNEIHKEKFTKFITNDWAKEAETDYHLEANKFVEQIIPNVGQIDCIDADHYGCPNRLWKKIFELIDPSSVPFTICSTDGLGLSLKLSPRHSLDDWFLVKDDEEWIDRRHPWWFHKELTVHFFSRLAESKGWKATPLEVVQSKNKNFVFSAFLIENA